MMYKIAWLAALIFAASSVSAQDNILWIYNSTNANKEICFYDASDRIALIAFRCETIGGNTTIKIDINNVDFSMRVFVPALLKRELYNIAGLQNISGITIGDETASFEKRLGAVPEPSETRYSLKVCNKSRPEPVYFTLAFVVSLTPNDPHYTYGWWTVEKDKCLEFPVSTMLKADWGVPFGTSPYIYYYGRTFGKKPMEWIADKFRTCINKDSKFKLKMDSNVGTSVFDKYCGGKGLGFAKTGMRFFRHSNLDELVILNF